MGGGGLEVCGGLGGDWRESWVAGCQTSRLDVTFRTGTKTEVVPGYFAADGTAAETSAAKGNKWKVHFSPDETGERMALFQTPLRTTATNRHEFFEITRKKLEPILLSNLLT